MAHSLGAPYAKGQRQAQQDLTRLDTIRHDMTRFSKIGQIMIRYGLARLGIIRHGIVWIGMVQCRVARQRIVRYSSNALGQLGNQAMRP